MQGHGRPAVGRDERAPGGHPQPGEFSSDVGRLAQKASAHLLAAGLELHSAMPLIGEGKTVGQCAGALGDIDDALKLIRQLVVAADRCPGDGRWPPQVWTIPGPRAGEGLGTAAEARGAGHTR